jgi:hypothetical protein
VTGHELAWDHLADGEIMVLSRAVLGWADRVFAACPPIRQGQILDWAQELIDLRDEVDRVILWRAIIREKAN